MSTDSIRANDEAFLRRLVLVAAALKKEGAAEVLNLLSEDSVEVASRRLSEVLALSRGARQALLASELGHRPGQPGEIQRMLTGLQGPLREAVLRQLPVFTRSVPPLEGGAGGISSDLARKWVKRLSRELLDEGHPELRSDRPASG